MSRSDTLWIEAGAAETREALPLPVCWRRVHSDPERVFRKAGEPGTNDALRHCLAIDGHRLRVRFEGDRPVSGGRGSAGEFTAELWRGTAAELFLLNPLSGRYAEINLSPTGAWWACLFSSPRIAVQADGWHIPDWQCSVTQNDAGGWCVTAEFSGPAILEALDVSGLQSLRGNLCLVHRGADEDLFGSRADLPGEIPNFHQPGHWLPVSVR